MKCLFWGTDLRRLKGLRLNEEKEIVHRTRPNGMAGREVAKSAKFQIHQLNVWQRLLNTLLISSSKLLILRQRHRDH
jgi:hypothetical protein